MRLVAVNVLSLLATIGYFPSFGEASVANEGCSHLTEPIWKETIGNGSDFPFDVSTVTITGQHVDEVTFHTSQLWNENGLPMVAVHFRTLDGDEQCSMETMDVENALIPFGTTKDYTAQCSHGYAEIGVYIYVGDEETFDIDECESCSAPDNNYVGYYLSLPCVPVCEPTTLDCFSEPTVHLADIGHESKCIYNDSPIMTEATSMKTDSVEFLIANTWSTDISALSVYYTNAMGEPECDVLNNMEGFSETVLMEAFCEHGMAEVIVQVHSNDINHIAEYIPDVCSTPSDMGTCSTICYTEPPTSFPTGLPTLEELPVILPPTDAPFDCTALSDPIWQETTGNEKFPYDNEFVTILEQNVDDVVFSVSQLWNKLGVPMFAVSYRSSNSEDLCSMETIDDGTLIPYDSSKTYTSKCTMGYAEIAIFVYVGPNDVFDVEECEACAAPDNNYVGYYLSLPCTPVCEIGTPSCLDEPTVVLADVEHQAMCVYDETPIMTETISMKTTSVEFVITNTWPEDISALSVHFINADGEPQCDTFADMEGFSVTSQIEAYCSEGIAEVGIQIYSSDIDYISGILPDACQAPDGMGHCSYEFVIPCMEDPDCNPIAPTDLPTTAPYDCVELSNPIWHETTGSQDFPYNERVVNILEQNVNEIKFTISQIWNKIGVPMFAVMYRTTDGDEQCSMETMDEGQTLIPYETTEVYEAQCTEGYAEIVVYAYVGSGDNFDPEECEACSAPDENYVAYVISLPCIPICKPEIPDCYEDPLLVLADIDHESMCIYDERPIQSDITSMTTNSVAFAVSNTWPQGIEELSIYYNNKLGEPQCQTRRMDDLEISSPIETFCINGMAEVIIQVHSPMINHVADKMLEGCARPEEMGTCSYEFVVPCIAIADGPCGVPESVLAPLTENPSLSPSSSPSSFPSRGPTTSPSTIPTLSPSSSPSASPSGGPSASPSASPSGGPSAAPSASPSGGPSASPSASPSGGPSASPSASPSGGPNCYMKTPPKIINSVCMSGSTTLSARPMPLAALVVNELNEDKIGFTVSQQWVEEGGLAVMYSPDAMVPSCSVKGNIMLGESEYFEGECLNGMTGATIVVFMEKDFKPEECEACNVDDLSDMGGVFCAYRVEIPCETISVECGEPSAEPSGSFFPSSAPSGSPTETSPSGGPSAAPSASPSSGPSASPSASPSGGPSASPSASPSEGPSESPSGSPSSTPTAYPTLSMMPTDCYMKTPPKIINSVCMSGSTTLSARPMPLAALVVNELNEDKIGFTVSQQWVEEGGLAVMYSPDAMVPSCSVKGNIMLGESEYFEGECLNGMTGATIVVFMEKDFKPEECEACNVDDLSDMGGVFCAYRVEIPCETISVECGEPSAEPSGSFFPSSAPSGSPTETSPSGGPSAAPSASPSSGPSASPSASPSGGPSASPSASPSEGPSESPSGSPSSTPTAYPTLSMMPTDCYMKTPPKIIASVCMSGDTQIGTIGFTVSQQWVEEGGIAVNFNDLSLESSCSISGNVTLGDSKDYEGGCIEGISAVTIVVYMEQEFDPEECEACNVDDLSQMGGTFCAYRVEIPCETISVECGEPSAAPSGSYFPSSAPSESPTKRFKVINTWDTTFTNMYTEYHEGGFGETECLEEENIESYTEVDEYMATCMHNVPVSIVNVWVVDANETRFDEVDDAEVPMCCHPPEFSEVPISDSDVLAFYKKDYCGPCVGGYGSKIKR
ncbi:hypothetical protein FRACYDRAFT_253369 [Fragilariopsis cylindrus CCMP1102]|uniref:DUF7633 domain-containing protein n=1 Tax=Fragilariopsis cylindrus CCMP1102 TaxID=635003 RepID=A0A1E7ELH8_9STRA|nr:hypothetical protein FRACYDRAFT_253369 [Fragilariopsis cylindrus CCMP1102]|eukprot:OEU06771.1 hypothetical protein FRACYDRAFT_253369 [Fragilariopsis cylindrus CCMP1102]